VTTYLAIFVSMLLKAWLLTWWDQFKARKALEPVEMVLRGGSYVAWGPVQKIQHYGNRLFQVWLVYMALILIALVAMWLGFWNGF
jgi:hypothetical protein